MKLSKKTIIEVGALGLGLTLGAKLLHKAYSQAFNKKKPDQPVDFDGTITDRQFVEDPNLLNTKPHPQAKEGLEKLSRTHNIVIWSARLNEDWKEVVEDYNKEEQIELMESFMEKYDLPYDRIETEKQKMIPPILDEDGLNWGDILR